MSHHQFVPRVRSGLGPRALALALGLSLLGASALAAQTGTVTGLVRDAVTQQPLPGAQVSVEGTGLGGLANNVGRYLLLNVPAGQHTITATLIGYGTVSQSVTVAAGQSAVLDFSLREQALALEGVVVTGTAGSARRREIGNQISQVSADDIELSAVTDIGDILQGRTSGVQINDQGGQVGTGSRIRLRGNSSLSQGNEPLIFIDGVRMENASISGDDDEAGTDATALDMINPNDIERIEVVKGPAATTLYGTEASGGVIQIFTKRGVSGAPAWSVNVDQGLSSMPLQVNDVNPEDINPTGYYLNDCSVSREFDTATKQFVTIPVPQDGCPESGSWFRNGHMQRYNLSVRGGSENVTYFVSGRFDSEEGVVDPQGADSYGVRANIQFQPVDGLDFSFNNSYQHREITWIPDGNNASGFLLNVMRGIDDYTNNNDALVFENDIISQIEQYQTGIGVSWTPNTIWSHRLNAGLDYTVHDFLDWKYWGFFEEPTGDREYDQQEDRNLTLDYVASLNYSPLEAFSSRLSFGGQLYEEYSYGVNGFDAQFAGPGEPVLGDGTVPSVDEDRVRLRSGGFFVQEQVGWQDKVFVTGGVRWDGFSTFGEGFGLAAYPKLSATYLISDESFWPTSIVETFKLRAAYGQSGRAPGAFDAEKLWEATQADELVPAVVIDNFGNADLGPERSTELEWGFDASGLDGRVTLEFTRYDQTTSDALVDVSPIPSTGTNNAILRNVGEVDNWGTELSLNVVPVRTDDVEWSVGGSWTTNDSEIVDLGPLQEIDSSLRLGERMRIYYNDQLIECGRDALAPDPCWDPDAAFDPANPPDLAQRVIGPRYPLDIVSLNTRVTFMSRLTLDVLGEGQYGHFLESGPAYQQMRRTRNNNPVWPYCAPIIDTWDTGDRTTLTNQQVVECVQQYSDAGVWTRPADFFRLRSATLAWRLPESWIPRTRSVQLSLQAKNLFILTDYVGVDPEGLDDGLSDDTPREYYSFGPPRTFILGVTVNF